MSAITHAYACPTFERWIKQLCTYKMLKVATTINQRKQRIYQETTEFQDLARRLRPFPPLSGENIAAVSIY